MGLVLGNHVSFVDVTLDLLSHTSTLHPQTVLDPVSKTVLGALASVWQQVLDAVLAGHLDQLGLAALRVDGVLPLARHGVLVEAEGVRPGLLGGRLGAPLGDDGGGGVSGEEALQRRWQRLCQLDEL